MISAPRIVIAGETFSYNLGDGVIADSMEFLARHLKPTLDVTLLDISARTGYGPENSRAARRMRQHGVRSRPPYEFNLLKWYLVRRRRSLLLWRPILAKAERLIIGGGQLLMDNQLDFPLKLSLLADEARSRRLPYHVLACGVGARWSLLGHRLVASVLDHAASVDVRDQVSKEHLCHYFKKVNATVSFDPAIWAAAVYGRPETARPVVGLGIIGMREVLVYADDGASNKPRDMLAFWLETIAALQRAGFSVELFTNGSFSDDEMANRILERLAEAGLEPCRLAPRPRSPRDLAHLVASYSAIVAARLHACITATSYRVPVVGLAWDAKVPAFFARIGRSRLCHDIRTCQPDQIVATLSEAQELRVSEDELGAWRDQALTAMRVVLESCS